AQAAPPPHPLQTAPRRRRRGGFSSLTYYLSLILTLIVIGVGLVLLLQQVNEENQEATPTPIVEAPPVIVATRLPPTPVPPQVRTVAPGSVVSSIDLPPTWTPVPTNTVEPTATVVENLTNFDDLTLIFSGADSPVDLRRLMLVQASGADLHPLNVPINPGQITFPARVTPVPPPQEVSPDEAASTQGDQVATATEETSPTASDTAAQEPELYDQMEFLDPAYSPDGSQVAFTVQISAEVQEIFVLTLETGIVRQLTVLGGSSTDGSAWSPDGTLLAFSSNAPAPNGNAGFDVYMVNVNTAETTNLTNGNGQNREPMWSPDGITIAFSSDRATPGELEVWSMQISSGEAIQLTDAINSSFSPAYSNDGTHIAFISNRGSDNDLYVMNADGTNEQLITLNDQNWDDRDPAWSPDDAWIALSSNREDERVLQLWLVRADGRAWQRVTETGGTSRFADWRP
ncbi:MAG TPA: hypothetical protein VJZ27_06330, partial [Aggregatilineales bacterium]|nr:hypothetical protein [Aggregatilineales bacterium]